MKNFILLTILLLSFVLGEVSWWQIRSTNFDVEKKLAERKDLSFRGCYGDRSAQELCLYVGSESFFAATKIRRFIERESVWVYGGPEKLPDLIFQDIEEKPDHYARHPSEWFVLVPSTSVAPPSTQDFSSPIVRNQNVADYVNGIDKDNIGNIIDTLATRFYTRNSLSKDAVEAAEWIKQKAISYGCQSHLTRFSYFRSGYSPNVECYLEGKTNGRVIIVGAHYDSRSTSVTSPTQRAPGADDNGTGSAALLELLRATTHIPQFHASILFVWFSGEEQGLYGSKNLASTINRTSTVAMLNMDMIGYDPSNLRTIYFDRDRVTTSLRDKAIKLVREYMEDRKTGLATGCCSDGDSFYSAGVPTVSVFEGASLVNPNYHKSTDLPNTVNVGHVRDNARAIAALLSTLAYE